MAAEYRQSSPWYSTNNNGLYLDVLSIRTINSDSDDVKYIIPQKYKWRPDRLAADYYGDRNLWWVFVQRNLDVIHDPIFDFTVGTVIYLPRKDRLFKLLGI